MSRISDFQPLTLLQAVSLSGGTTDKGGGKVFILRAADGRQPLTVDLNKMMRGKGDDVILKPNDMVFVPDSRSKRYTEAMLTSLITTFTYGIMGAVLWR